jgi:hypothetical protein
MSYELQALVGDESVLRAASPADVTVIPLPQHKALIPLSTIVQDRYGIPFLPFTDEGVDSVTSTVMEFILPFARCGRIVYIEAEFFGGDGTQACIMWDRGGQPSAPLVDNHAINTALRFLGVKVGNHHDEFDALGLGRYRGTDDWEESAKFSEGSSR